MTAVLIDPEMLKTNYMALRLYIIDENVTVERSVEVLVSKFPTGDRRKPGVIPKFSRPEMINMKCLLEDGQTYAQVAERYGLVRGDNIYQILRRADLLPENKIRGRRLAAI